MDAWTHTRDVMRPKVLGMVDVNALYVSCSEVSCVNDPMVLGMDPLKPLYCSSRACKEVIAEMDGGMVPLKLENET